MQIKDQWKRPRDWKVVAGVGAVAALGITGLLLANPADGSLPRHISLEERARIAETRVNQPIPPVENVIDLSRLGDETSSPFGDLGPGAPVTGGDDSPESGSPDDGPAAPSAGDADSDDDSAAPSPGDTDPPDDDSPEVSSPDDGPAPPGDGDDSPDDSSPARGGGGGDDSDDDSQVS